MLVYSFSQFDKMKKFLLLFSIFFSVKMFSQEWTLLTPLRTNSEVKGCSFLDEQRGFAVTMSDGDILKTTDGGVTWRRLWAPNVSANLLDVAYVTEDTVFVCGNNGGIFRSVDGGNSWTDVNPPTSVWMYQLHFVNSQLGFGLGESGTIVRTQDGGDTWQLIASNATARLVSIDFVNSTTGYIAGWSGTILKTIDAGLTWTNLNVPFANSFTGISFVDDQVGFACGTNIVKTTNGGLTWTQVSSVASNGLNYIHFRNASVGWAVGGFGNYFTTTNGGTTWNSSTPLGSEDFFCGEYVSSSAAYVCGRGIMYKSTTNGASWTAIKTGVPRAEYLGIWFQNDSVGTVVGAAAGTGSNQTGIITTSDGGKTWQKRQQSNGGGWYGVHYPTATTGYAVGVSGLAKTTNGGVNWTYSTPFTLTAQSVYFKSNNEGFVAGDINVSGMCHTTNGGTSFTCESTPIANSIQFVGNNIGYAIHSAQASTFYKTTDGGATWENLTGMGGSNFSLHFITEEEGWVGSNGIVWHTTDGGLNWTETFATNAPIVGIHFYSPLLGFVVDQNNTLLKTNDGGLNWTVLLSTNFTMYGCYKSFFTENYCYITSSAGDIFRTELGCTQFTANNIVGDSQWCEGQLGSLFTPNSIPTLDYQWTLPEGWTGGTTGPSIEPIPSSNSGLVSLTVTNACGLQSTVYYDVNVTPAVDPNITISGPNAICSDGNYEYTVPMDLAATEYLWQVSSQYTYTINNNVLIIHTASGNGVINVRTSNECGISPYAFRNISLIPAPTVLFELNTDSICASSVLPLNGGEPSGGSYSGPSVLDGIFTASGLADSQIEITYFYTSNDGCSASAVDSIYVYDEYNSPANFNSDCGVDESDLDIFMQSFGCVGECGVADLNNDGVVGVDDLFILVSMMTD
jgi:photosystem II stability/assembly factor-like uncharacterized protein